MAGQVEAVLVCFARRSLLSWLFLVTKKISFIDRDIFTLLGLACWFILALLLLDLA